MLLKGPRAHGKDDIVRKALWAEVKVNAADVGGHAFATENNIHVAVGAAARHLCDAADVGRICARACNAGC